MSKWVIAGGLYLILSISVLPAYAMGGGMAGGMSGGMGGSGMMDNFGSGLLEWFQKWRNGSGYSNPTPGQDRRQMQELDQRHDEDSVYLKYQIQMKEKQLDALLASKDPDLGKVRTLNKDIRELRAQAEQEQREYELEAGRMNRGYGPENAPGGGSYGPGGRSGSGRMGYRGGMMGYGQAQ